MATYGLDLRVEAEAAGLRRLWVLIQGLPPDAAVWREESAWTTDHELAAAQIEVADRWGRFHARQQGAKTHQLPEPIHIPRPGEPERKQVTTDPTEIAAFFNKHLKGG